MPTQEEVQQAIQILQASLEAGAKTDPVPVSVEPLGKFDVTSEFADVPRETVDALLFDLKVAEKLADDAKERVSAAKQAVIDVMAGAEVLRIAETQQEVVSHRVVTATVIDTGRFRLERPEIAAEYQKERTSRPFKVLL